MLSVTFTEEIHAAADGCVVLTQTNSN